MGSESAAARELMLRLSRAGALVRFELLARSELQDRLEVEHAAEDRVLTDLLGQLERTLVEPLEPEYAHRLASARAELTAVTDSQ